MKLPRPLTVAVCALIASCVNPMRPESRVRRVAAPALETPLVESYPRPAEPGDPVKAVVFARINRDRTANGLPPVLWDESASRVADAFCAQQVREKTHGHYLMDGVPPYARTGFAGIFGLGSENSVSWLTTSTWADQNLAALGLSGHDRMMEERPPKDGHRRTILDPDATHVGIGYFARGGRFQMSQEFLARRLDRLALSIRSGRRLLVAVEGRVLAPERIQFVTIAREPKPTPLTQTEANARTSYAYPEPGEAYVPEHTFGMHVGGTVTQDRLRLRKDREFSFLYEPAGDGLYTFVFYVAAGGRMPKPGGSATVLFE